MHCTYQDICGGCPLRSMNNEDYRKYKIEQFKGIVSHLKQAEVPMG